MYLDIKIHSEASRYLYVKSLDGYGEFMPSSHRNPDDDPDDSKRRDEVDLLVTAWRHERPDLDLAPLHILSRVTRLARRLDIARRAAFADHDLDGWEFDVLSALRRAGSPYELSPGDLIRDTMVTSGTMTNRVDRLVARGYVSRRPDPSDRRGVIVGLTESGTRSVDSALESLLRREQALLADLSDTDQAELADLLRRLVIAVSPRR